MGVLHEKTIQSKKIYDGKIIKVRLDTVRLPDGNESYREIVEHRGAVAMVPLEGDSVYLIKQFRKPIEKILLEIPAGRLEALEDPEECARRELAEEIGYWPQKLQLLSIFYTSPGFSNEKIYLYLAEGLVTQKAQRDEGEFLEIVKLPLREAVKKIATGEIEDGKTITGLLLARNHFSGRE